MTEITGKKNTGLHTRILIGLIVGAVLGILANTLLGGKHPAVEWLNHYIAGPAGQIFLRLLFMIVMPLVFASITLGVDRILDMSRTVVNVLGDLTATAYLARSEGFWNASMVPSADNS
ncbi:MAG: hypothetical protein COT18_08025 [Elusimicrobia bacterium CG08_land_8_20_14_0_20_59_10]|nr:MAG: hypothetical protein COT18_08025 [Elusimicrobia bacterium CG08_land_8_20_14_0_20_59_10]